MGNHSGTITNNSGNITYSSAHLVNANEHEVYAKVSTTESEVDQSRFKDAGKYYTLTARINIFMPIWLSEIFQLLVT